MCSECALGVLWVCSGCALCVHCCARRLADFFIAKLLGKHSSLDELPSLDEELFSSLDFVKRCPPSASTAPASTAPASAAAAAAAASAAAHRVTGQVASPGPSPYPCAAASLGARSHTRLRCARGSYDGNLEEDLCLTFSVDEEAFGQRTAIELRPGGRVTAVTKENRIEYIHLMADYRLNRQLATQNPNP